MSSDELLWSQEQTIGRVVLNRPDRHNAISKKMWQDIPGILNSLQQSGARVIVFSGGGSSFASGADLDELKNLDNYTHASAYWHAIRDCLNYIWTFELPTIAMINGTCLGGGCLLALTCDLRYAVNSASFGIPTAKLGIILDDSNIFRLIASVGTLYAKEMLLIGGIISSTIAFKIGLVNDVLEPDMLETTVNTVAKQIADNDPASIKQAKLSINRFLVQDDHMPAQNEKTIIASYLNEDFRQRLKRRKGPSSIF